MGSKYNPTALQFYRWVLDHYDYQLRNRLIAEPKAKAYCRERWFEFGEATVKKAIAMPNCTDLRKFECLCLEIKDIRLKLPLQELKEKEG